VLFWAGVLAAEPRTSPTNETRIAGAKPRPELASFQVEPGFRLDLVASEPMVSAPVAMAFDENGRLFVVEARDAQSDRVGQPTGRRIRLLERPDNKGVFQSSTVYSDDVPSASAVACWDGGIFVAATPDVVYLKAAENGGPADTKKVVLQGLGGTNRPASDKLINNFKWGLDGQIYAASPGIEGPVSVTNNSGGVIQFAAGAFSFDPRTFEVLPEAGPAESGLTLTSTGRELACSDTRPLMAAMYEPRYTERNPFYPRPPEMKDAASPATLVFPFRSAVGSNAIARAATSLGTLESFDQRTNLHAAAWMTRAQGCEAYRGNLFPTNYTDNVFIADPAEHVVRRVVLREDDLDAVALRPPEERQVEFLASKDPSFRPAQVINGPDGALYIADTQDGAGRGRIYRVAPVDFKPPKPLQLGKASAYELVALLAAGNGWQQDTARRLLCQRQDPDALPLLSNVVANARGPLARVRALHALRALGGLNEAVVLTGMRDPDALVREHAVQVAEGLAVDGNIPEAIWKQMKLLTSDRSLRVRYQLALTAGWIRRPEKPLLLSRLLLRDAANPWTQNAVLSSVADDGGELFVLLSSEARFRKSPPGQLFLRNLGGLIGTKGNLDEVSQVLKWVAGAPLEPLEAFAMLRTIGEGLHRTRSSLALVDQAGVLPLAYAQALDAAINTGLPAAVRVEATRLLAVSPYTFTGVGDWLVLLCNPQPFPALRAAAIETMGSYEDPRVLSSLLECWPGFTPGLRMEATWSLLSRTSRVPAVLTAIEQGKIKPGQMSPSQLNFLRTYPDPEIRERALRLFGPVMAKRPLALKTYSPTLKLTGRGEHGARIYASRCAGCHQFGGSGVAFGPDLTGARTKGKERLLEAILEPSTEISPAYATSVIQTQEGENLMGIVGDETSRTITVKQVGGNRAVWPWLNVRTINRERWSLMPAGIEQGLSAQDMADLLNYLMSGK